ncbi:MAG: hypothetical protein JOZ81_24200 [Chloroflexi bacterium]|nr:hypothetical protein [Chloroflexota bacterium]
MPPAPSNSAAAPTTAVLTSPRIPPADPMNGGFLIANQHGMLFHDLADDAQEDIAYARWLGAGIIRVFATDNNGFRQWDGRQVGNRIADRAPLLRAANMRLIVALVNNHRAVPGEPAEDVGWMDNYIQLLLPFYTDNWRGPYLQFTRDLISTVQARGALDVIYAWELGNELHTPRDPTAVEPFITAAAAEVRAMDPQTPILPGTMGANHVEPGNPNSSIARWLYCDAPIDAYTLHAYDWVSRDRGGDMPIDWDLDNIVSQPCPSGRQLPVVVEELGTSRGLPGVYSADDESDRVAQERRQIDFVRQFPQVVGFGVWNAESPRLIDRTFIDVRRGLTSYGANAQGGGSCYDPTPELQPGPRCSLEQALRGIHFVRSSLSSAWQAGMNADSSNPLLGNVSVTTDGTAITGWALDPSVSDSTGITDVVLYAGDTLLAQAQLGVARPDVPQTTQNNAWSTPGFTLSLPFDALLTGSNPLTVMAHTSQGAVWTSNVQVVMPILGGILPAKAMGAAASSVPAVQPTPTPPRVLISWPTAGASVSRAFTMQGTVAAGVDRVDIFMDSDRDAGGVIVGSAVPGSLAGVRLNRSISSDEFYAVVNVSKGNHVLYIHGHSTGGGDTLVTLAIAAQ